jgi:dihydrofolate reductase
MRQLTIIAALDSCGGIGKHGNLPWRLPPDLAHFKATTLHSTILMGRKTFRSLPGGALPNRRNIIISRHLTESAIGFKAEVANSLDDAFWMSQHDQKVFIIGGGEIYKEALPYCDKMILTRVQGDFHCDTHFPAFDPLQWDMTETTEQLCPRSELVYVFQTYERKRKGSPQ